MKKIILTIIFLLISFPIFAADLEFNVFGINPKHFKDRSPAYIIIGAATSILAHELGHYVVAEYYNMDPNMIISIFPHENHVEYRNYITDHEHQMFSRAGFLSQLAIGSILTILPKTRHSDFTLGFNGFAFSNTSIYIMTEGLDKESSDIENLHNGRQEGIMYSFIMGTLTYINLKKEKQ